MEELPKKENENGTDGIKLEIKKEDSKNGILPNSNKKIDKFNTEENKVDKNASCHDGLMIVEKYDRDLSPRNVEGIIIQENRNEIIPDIRSSESNIIDKEKDNINDLIFDKSNNEFVFFFINPASGSKEGQHLINMAVKKVEFIDTIKCIAFIYNIRDRTNYLEGVNHLKNLQEKFLKSIPRVIIGGGDGTVLSVIEELATLGINVQNCFFGVLPLGTGNDLANSLGWGTTIKISSDMAQFKLIVQEIKEAIPVNMDVWELRLKVDENEGAIIQIVGDSGEKAMKKESKSNRNLSEYKRSFINYFSLGYDARVGFGFDKLRTSNRCCNKFIYFWEGCKKICCRKTLKVNGFIESFSTLKTDNHFFESSEKGKDKTFDHEEIFRTKTMDAFQVQSQRQTQAELTKTKTVVSKSSNYVYKNKIPDEYTEVVLRGDPVAIICQNINNYMGGVSNIWNNSKKLGVELFNPQTNSDIKVDEKTKKEEEKKIFEELIKAEQNFGDGKLEFFGFDSGISFGLEKIFSGFANKIYQGSGPILIKFKEISSKTEEDKENRVYLNIDGEYFNLVKAKDLRVRSNKKFQDGKIKFLSKISQKL